MKMSPESAVPDIDFDAKSETAWSSRNKPKRAYGKTADQWRETRMANKKRGNIQRHQDRDSKPTTATMHLLEEEGSEIGDALSTCASYSSLSSFGRSDSLRSVPGAHVRSLSVSALARNKEVPHRRSYSVSDPQSTSSDSFSRSCSTFSDSELENRNPNVISQIMSQEFGETGTPPSKPPLKIKKVELDSINEHLKARPRKIRNISDFGPLAGSFSHIAQSGETWTKAACDDPHSPRASLVFDGVADLDTAGLSPAKSLAVSVSSSRKRGVWEFDDDVEECRSSKGVVGVRRSRSRIFSPGSSLRLQASNPFLFESDDDGNLREILSSHADPFVGEDENDINMREKEKEFDTTDDDETELGSDVHDDLSIDGSFDSVSNSSIQANEGIDELPFMPPLAVRRSASTGRFEDSLFGSSGPKGKNLTESHILDSMPSYDNLKFIIKALRTEKKGSAVSSFRKNKSWIVAPLGSWSPDQRVAFLQWSTKELGFTVRSGGGNIAFLQISSTKGLSLLDNLEAALKIYRETSGKTKVSSATSTFPRSKEFSIQKVQQGQTGRTKVPDAVSTFPISMEFSIQKSQPAHMFDFSNSKSSRHSFSLSPVQDTDNDVTSELLGAVKSMALVDKPKSKKRSSGSSLVRHVTLEPRRDSFDGKIDDDSKNIRSSRHSGEHHAGNIDLLQNMHGYSPMATSRRPTRLATGRPPVCSSPFVGSTRSGQKGRFSFGSECIETPLAKRGIADWSSHQKGRDWGVGRSCPESILQELIRRFEDRYTSEGNELETSFDAPDGNSPSSSIFESFKMPGAGARTSNLEFEYEADVGTGMRDVTSDPEEEEEEDEEEEEEEEDDFTEIKLAPRASGLVRQNSVGASLLSVLHLTGSAIYIDSEVGDEKRNRRRMGSLAKHRRVSLCAQMADSRKSLRPRKSSFAAIDREAVLLGRKSILPSKFGLKEDRLHEIVEDDSVVELCAVQQATSSMKILANVFSFLSEVELLMVTTPVCSFWADASAEAHANLMLVSVGCAGPEITDIDDDVDVEMEPTSIALAMERPWGYLVDRFPWACFLSEGAFKRVYKVWNSAVQAEEALSVMDVNVIEDTGNKHIVGAELAVSALLSSLVRRNICPNFVLTRQVFTSHHEPPAAHWGCADNKRPKGSSYVPGMELGKKPRLPPAKKQGRFQYMRMELCTGGDIEEFLKRQPDEIMPIDETRALLFQMAFSLHAAADRFSLKHYDVKLLNFFLQTFTNVDSNHTVLRYGLGSHVFSLRMPTSRALVAKLADYGTANVQAESNGQPVTIGHFTTLENTPPDYMILGDAACQGHGHDAFGLGLCMLHVFTGHAPYEEIMEEVHCPSGLKKKLKKIWEDEGSSGYDVIRSVILADVEKDEDGVAVEGEPDETFYHTFYRYLVLFGIPADKFQIKNYGRVWRAVSSSIESCSTAKKGYGRSAAAKKCCPDATQFANDQGKYSLSCGSNEYIARARRRLESMEGGLELLISLVNFDPEKRATATDVLNSSFMAPLREGYPGASIQEDDYVLSYMAYATTL